MSNINPSEYKVGDIVVVKESFQTVHDWYGNQYGSGTIKVGSKFKIIKLPTPEKKMYKLEEINESNIRYKSSALYVRKSFLKQNFEVIDKNG